MSVNNSFEPDYAQPQFWKNVGGVYLNPFRNVGDSRYFLYTDLPPTLFEKLCHPYHLAKQNFYRSIQCGESVPWKERVARLTASAFEIIPLIGWVPAVADRILNVRTGYQIISDSVKFGELPSYSDRISKEKINSSSIIQNMTQSIMKGIDVKGNPVILIARPCRRDDQWISMGTIQVPLLKLDLFYSDGLCISIYSNEESDVRYHTDPLTVNRKTTRELIREKSSAPTGDPKYCDLFEFLGDLQAQQALNAKWTQVCNLVDEYAC